MTRGGPSARETRENGRELEALVLACVWVLGVEAFPLHHQLAHASLAPHVHAAPGEVAHSHGEVTHSHGDGVWHVHADGRADRRAHEATEHARDAARVDGPRGSSRASLDTASPRHAAHGAGSLAHKQLLFPAPASPMPAVAEALFAYVLLSASTPRLESVAASAPARARGPPSLANGLRCAAT